MGSIARQSSLDLFVKVYGDKLEEHFKPRLVGKRITGIQNITANYYVQANVAIDKETYPIHFRWTGQEEDAAGVELDEDFVKLEDYYNQLIHQKQIENVVVGYADRDDEVYLICFTGNGGSIDIPLGFDTDIDCFSSFSEDILSQEERDAYSILRQTELIVERWNYSNKEDIDLQAAYLDEIKDEVFGEDEIEQEYKLSDFEKLSSIWTLFNNERIDCLNLLTKTKKIITQ